MISKFSVKRPYAVIVGIILIIILGVVSFMRMTTDLLPNLELPYAVVVTTYGGASPEQVETGVTRPIEQALATIDNIKDIQSVSSENYSMIILEFNGDTNMDTATLDMRESLDQISGYFDDMVGNPMIIKINPNMLPVMVSAVNIEGMDAKELSYYVENELAPDLEGVEGVASVTTMGAIEEKVEVVIREDKVKAVNKKVKAALDDKFKEAQEAIDEGAEKLEDGKKKVEDGQKAANKGFAEGEIKIDDAKYALLKTEEEVSAALADLLEQEKALLAQEEELKKTKETLETGIAALEEVSTNYKTLVAQKAALEAAIAANPSDLASLAMLQAVENGIAMIKSELAKQKGMDGSPLTVDNLDTNIASMKTALAEVKAGLKSIKEAKKQIEDGKKKLNDALKKITNGKKDINDATIDLKVKKAETESELTTAKAQLEQGASELEKQKSQFEDAKDAAYEGADMNTILTKDMVSGILMAQNFAMPAGYITENKEEYLIRVGDKFESVEDISDFVLLDMGMDGLEPIKLSDVADVELVNNADDIYARLNKNPGIILSIAKQNEYATADVSDNLKDYMEEVKKENSDFGYTVLMDQGLYIDLVIDSVLNNLLVGAVLAVFILLFFLKDIRPTLIIAVSIPVSLVFAVVLMYFSGVTLNIISLSGLALGVGMLVDNSIVVIENIYRLRREGFSIKSAAIKGTSQMATAITASTLTTICVFLPIVFTTGLTKQLFVDMGLTIAYSLLASLAIALTFVPMIASVTFNKIESKDNQFIVKLADAYIKLLPKLLNKKWLVLGFSLIMLVVSVVWSLSKGYLFIPSMDSPQMSMSIQMPEETNELSETVAVSDEVINRVLEIEDVQTIGAILGGSQMSMLGFGGAGSSSVDSVSYYIECKEDKKLSNQEIADLIMEKTKDLNCEVSVEASSMDMSALGGSGISIRVEGKELDQLAELATQVAEKIESVEGLIDISDGQEDAKPEYKLMVDKAKAAKYGLTVAQVFSAVQATLAEPSTATVFTTPSKDYNVYVSEEVQEEITLNDIKNMTIAGKEGEESVDVKISKIAEVVDAQSLNSINRNNQVRGIYVSAGVDADYNVSLLADEVEEILKDMELPAGYRIVYDGENEMIMDAVEQVMLMMILAVIFMYLIMVVQFESLKSPFIIMFTVPLAFTGGFFLLALTGKELSVIAMIGLVMLAGIIVNNGIVLVDTINQFRFDEGMLIRDAIILAGKNRLRPIMMTALTTILALSTMALGMGMGADMVQPMALVTMGGLVYGTLLTMFAVPCIYELFNKDKKKDSIENEDSEDDDLE